MARPGPASEGSSSRSLIASAQGSDSPRMAATCEENCVVNGEQPAVPSSGAAGPSAPAAAAAAACPGGLTFDQALTQYVGEFGRGQIANFVLASLVWIPNAVIILLLVFSVGSPIKDKAWECVDPADPACVAVLTSTDPAVGFCSLQRDQWRWLEPSKTLVAQFDLVCKDAWKSQTANSFFFVGYLIGSGLFGQLSDVIGRKYSIHLAAAISAVFAAAGTACTTYWAWLAMRLLSGIGAAGTALGAYILATEAIGPSWRGAMGIYTQVFFIFGEFTLVVIAVLFSSWRAQAAACAVLNGAVLLMWPLLPESGRWLLCQGRKEEAVKVLELFARLNGTQPPAQPLADIKRNDTAEGTGQRLTLGAALRDWHIARRFLVLSYSWMVICMTYYGISFALSSLGGSLMVSFIVSCVAELPSYIFTALAIDRWGRHNTMAACVLLGGAACTCCAFVPTGGAQMALASIGKFGIAGAFGIASIYTSELFPTLIRSGVLGVSNQAARVGGIVAPFIAMAGSGANSSLVPFLTFGLAALVSGLLIFTLPETLGTPLPDSMDDMGVIASIFTHKTLAKKGFKAAAQSMFKTRVKLPTEKPRSSWLAKLPGSKDAKAAGKQQQQQSIWEEDEAALPGEEEGVAVLIPAHRPGQGGPQGGSGTGGEGGGAAGTGSGAAAAGTGGSATAHAPAVPSTPRALATREI